MALLEPRYRKGVNPFCTRQGSLQQAVTQEVHVEMSGRYLLCYLSPSPPYSFLIPQGAWLLGDLCLPCSDTHLCSGGLGSAPVDHDFHACALWSPLLFWLPRPHSCSSTEGRDGLRAERLPALLYLVARHSEFTVPVPVLSG